VGRVLRDETGVAKYRHEALAVVLQVRARAGSGAPGPGAGEGLDLCFLAWRRSHEPFTGRWALPSGPVEVDETLDASVRRHLAEKLDLGSLAHLEQLETLSEPDRDPYERTIASAYLGLVPFGVEGYLPAAASWLPVAPLPGMAFDHARVVAHGVERLRAKLSYTNLGFALAPGEFTLALLRDLYAAALGHEVSATNLQRVLVRRGQLVATGESSLAGPQGGRPARLFRFSAPRLEVTDPFAVLRPTIG